MAKSIYDIIKKRNGEGFARVLRDKNLLDIPDIAHIVKYAGHSAEDAANLFPYLWYLKGFKKENDEITNADPFQLLDMAGYHAFEVHNLTEQNSIKRFFREDEELCTFHDKYRYQENYIIHAVKHAVWHNPYAIKPSQKPQRQDEYGTSVISIQIRKDGGFISIKNRYNHSVNNPDQTFNSDPDQIIPGLSAALKGYFNVDWESTGVTVPDGFVLANGQVLKYNLEVNNRYFGDGFYTHGNQIIDIDRNNQVQMDYFVWDNKTKELLNLSGGRYDDFLILFNKLVKNKKVTISGKAPNQIISVDSTEIIKLENNQIVTLNLPDVTSIGNGFLENNEKLSEISLPNVTEIGYGFLEYNEKLSKISLPNVTKIGYGFLQFNKELSAISLPNVTEIGDKFLEYNEKLSAISLPNVTKIGDGFLEYNERLSEISLPNVTKIGDWVLMRNKKLSKISLPNVTKIGKQFLEQNETLSEISLPNVTEIGIQFLGQNETLSEISLPNVTKIGHGFLRRNKKLSEISLPNVTEIDEEFLRHNKKLSKISLPNVTKIGARFLQFNKELSEISLPNVIFIGTSFLGGNKKLSAISLPNVTFIGDGFLCHNKKLKTLSVPMLTLIPENFLEHNNSVIVDLPTAANMPITDLFPERRNKVQDFKHAITNFYNYIYMKCHTNSDYEI